MTTPTKENEFLPPAKPTKQADVPIVKFPPFPEVPPGVVITPFKDFKEHGIQIFSSDAGDEVDGLGIPTVELRVPHDTDECKTDSKRKKEKQKMVEQSQVVPTRQHTYRTPIIGRKQWWEYWEEGEDLRLTAHAYNPNMTRIDRMYQAATDFRLGRSWPPWHTKVTFLWDQFRIFVGLLGVTPIWNRTDRSPPDEEADEVLSDDEDEFESADASKTNLFMNEQLPPERRKKYPPHLRARPPYAFYGAEPVLVDSDEAVRMLLDDENIRKEEKLIAFLNDPETAMKIFFSSYMRKEGLIWTDRYLQALPRLLKFFINFLLRNRVLPESSHERGLRRSLDVIQQAFEELPLTSKVAKLLPEEFGLACSSCWEPTRRGKKSLAEDDSDVSSNDPMEKFEEELKAANVEIIKTAEDMTPEEVAKQILTDNIEGEVSVASDNSDYDPSAFHAMDEASGDSAIDLWAPVKHSLLPLLGPTALPLTHTVGVVEYSMRRVKSFSPPPANLPKSPISGSEGSPEPDPDAVEIELERRFCKVVLGPWVDWDEGEMPELAKPEVLDAPAGAVLQAGQDPSLAAEGAPKPYDPMQDDITLLVQPAVLNALFVGMGLAGSWVQLVKRQDVDLESGEEAKKRKKKRKSKAKKTSTTYWFMDELAMSIVSFWAAGSA